MVEFHLRKFENTGATQSFFFLSLISIFLIKLIYYIWKTPCTDLLKLWFVVEYIFSKVVIQYQCSDWDLASNPLSPPWLAADIWITWWRWWWRGKGEGHIVRFRFSVKSIVYLLLAEWSPLSTHVEQEIRPLTATWPGSEIPSWDVLGWVGRRGWINTKSASGQF